MLFWGYSFIIIKCDWGKFFLKIGNWLSPTIKNKQVTSSNSSFELWIGRKYIIELRPVKICKKGLVFITAKTQKDITNHPLKLDETTLDYPN